MSAHPGTDAAGRPDPPAGAYDCHTHVFGPFDRFPLAAARSYTPGPAGVPQLREHLAGLGVERVVLVQPSPYGTDNTRLVAALAELGTRAVGVAVPPPDATDGELRELHRAGVRGIRVNLHSVPRAATPAETPAAALRRAAEQAARNGWHLQVFASTEALLGAAATLATLEVPVVIDHFGLVSAPGPELDALCELLRRPHTWVKLSAPERSGADPDDPRMAEVASAILRTAPDRAVWASDWPHTDGRNRGEDSQPEPFRQIDDSAALDRLWRWCGDQQRWQAILHDNPHRLYIQPSASRDA